MTLSMKILLLLAVVVANLPFLSNKWFGLKRLPRKHFGHHLVELALGYVLIGLLARFLEGQVGTVHPQGWEFYVTTLALFLVFGFPAFVWRYFWRSKHAS